MSTSPKKVETIEIRSNTVMLFVHKGMWTNSKQADMSLVDTGETNKDMLKVLKKLVDCPEYLAVKRVQTNFTTWIKKRSMPFFGMESVYLVDVNAVTEIDAKIKEFQGLLKDSIETFIAVYPEKKAEARETLKQQWNESDYPSEDSLRERFKISTAWRSFGVPDNLPSDVKKEADALFAKQMDDIAKDIRDASRISFMELITKSTEMLEGKDDGKKKKIYSGNIEKVMEFIDLFSMRNFTNDVELAKLVEVAKAVLSGVDADTLRASKELREFAVFQLGDVKEKLSALAINKPGRKFNI